MVHKIVKNIGDIPKFATPEWAMSKTFVSYSQKKYSRNRIGYQQKTDTCSDNGVEGGGRTHINTSDDSN